MQCEGKEPGMCSLDPTHIFWVGKYGLWTYLWKELGRFLCGFLDLFMCCKWGTWQVYKCGKIQHCPGGLPGQCNGGLVGTPCAECPAGGTRFMGLSIHSNDKETRSDEIHWNSMTFCKWQERLVTIVVQSSSNGSLICSLCLDDMNHRMNFEWDDMQTVFVFRPSVARFLIDAY